MPYFSKVHAFFWCPHNLLVHIHHCKQHPEADADQHFDGLEVCCVSSVSPCYTMAPDPKYGRPLAWPAGNYTCSQPDWSSRMSVCIVLCYLCKSASCEPSRMQQILEIVHGPATLAGIRLP